MLLQELCEDILNLIIAELSTDAWLRRCLCHLARTCKTFHRLARPYIPRNIWISIPSQQFSALMRSLESSPSYGYGARKLVIQRIEAPLEFRSKEVFSFLQLLPNLRSLIFALPPAKNRNPHLLFSDDLLILKSLRHLELSNFHALTPSSVLKLASRFPQLYSVFFTFCVGIHRPLTATGRSHQKIDVQLESLHFHKSIILSSVLQDVLQGCKAPKTLHCRVPYLTQTNRKGSLLLKNPQTRDQLSPFNCVQTLLPVANTLRTLELETTISQWQGWDGTRMVWQSLLTLLI